MSPFSGAVLGGAALVSAPALWNSLVMGTMPVADGLLRYLVTVAVCWLSLTVVAALVGPIPPSAPPSRAVTGPSGGPPAGPDDRGRDGFGGSGRRAA